MDAQGAARYVDMGVLDLRKVNDGYEKLRIIFDKVTALCELHSPDCLAIESPFYGRNAQVIFKLGRAQGAAMVAAVSKGLEVYEYAPRKAKMSICGNGAASKEQVALIVERTLGINIEARYLDATDALAIAMCHYYQITSPLSGGADCKPAGSGRKSGSWAGFIAEHPDRVK